MYRGNLEGIKNAPSKAYNLLQEIISPAAQM